MYRKHLLARLAANPSVSVLESTRLEGFDDGIARLQGPNGLALTKVSNVLIAQGRATGTPLATLLEQAGIRFALVGDVESIGRIGDAVHAARAAVTRAALG